ncbi:hypothetical protein ACFYSC_32775 [Streptosporangium sp. NPDC004379]|uniref:hypothetical protein n=1 Tax=Streptosporangium sp. NPDC004379 TaxID=3366189 RepID=UPI0036A9234C
MLRLWKAIARTLCAAALVAAGLTVPAVSTVSAAADLPRWAWAVVGGGSAPTVYYQFGTWASGLAAEAVSGDPGQVLVRFPQFGAAGGGVAHVTAISSSADWCQVQDQWPSGDDLIVAVRCQRYGVGPVTPWFSVVFGYGGGYPSPIPRQALGYVRWDGSAVATQFNSARFGSPAPAPVNTVTPGTSPGLWRVALPGLGSAGLAGSIQVTAVDPAVPARCKVGGWTATTAAQNIVVRCHDAAGAPLNTGWNLTYHRESAVVWAPGSPYPAFAYTFDNDPGTAGSYVPTPYPVSHNSVPGGLQISGYGTGLRRVAFGDVNAGYGRAGNVQVTAFGSGAEFCNLYGLWTESVTGVLTLHACYDGATRVVRPATVTYVTRPR